MEFTSSDYNTESKWMNLYNATLYFYDIPIMYTPWFGYSLDTTRRSGLLLPAFGYSKKEGFFYEQPIYIAEQDWWDLELKPQIRTDRGKGIYSTFRFTDSKYSEGSFTYGYFKEDQKYLDERIEDGTELVEDSHHGFNFHYENSNFLNLWTGSSFEGQSGLYADINGMNDVDYINLASNNLQADNVTSSQVESKVNMFYNNDSDYFGAYFKYYDYLDLANNDKVTQTIPKLHYHHYLETLFDDTIIYNLDIQSENLDRKEGKTVVKTDINIPFSVHTSIFDELIDLTYSTNFYTQHSKFGGSDERVAVDELDDGYILKNDHQIAISTQLTKAYQDFTHVVGFSTRYTFDGGETSDGFYTDFEKICRDPLRTLSSEEREICSFYNVSDVQEQVQLSFIQYVYDKKGKQKLYHRLTQAVLYKDDNSFIESDSNDLGELENELEYQVTDSISFYNDMFYNHDHRQFSKIYNKLTYSDSDYGLTLSVAHLYQNNFQQYTPTTTPYTSFLTSSISYDLTSHYTLSAIYDYDIELHITKRKEFGFMYKKRCWDFGLRYVENNRPTYVYDGSGTASADAIRDRYIYMTVALKPFMQSDGAAPLFAYKIPEDDDE
jgi:LPS-assembly protein